MPKSVRRCRKCRRPMADLRPVCRDCERRLKFYRLEENSQDDRAMRRWGFCAPPVPTVTIKIFPCEPD